MEKITPILEHYYQIFLNFLPKLGLSLITLLIGFWIISYITKLVQDTLNKAKTDLTITRFVSSLVSVGMKVMLLLSVASMFGIETTSFIAILTALAFAIGTALSGNIGHFASGVMLLIFKPYRVGDLITLQGQTGVVENIHVFNTTILTPDNKRIIIPNGVITSGIITNISGQQKIRVDMTFDVASEQDIDKVRAAFQEIARLCPTTLTAESTDIFVGALKGGTVEMVVRPWCKSEYYWDTYFFFHEQAIKTFAKYGIKTPKNALDVSILQ